jgi:hypothetical protein
MLGSLILVNCGKNGDDGNGGSQPGDGSNYALTPRDCPAIQYPNQIPNPNCRNYYALQQGFAPYPIQGGGYAGYSSQAGYCGCQNGYRPTFSSNYGMGCINSGYSNQYSYYGNGQTYYYTPGWSNNQWTNIPQVQYNNAPTNYGSGNNCYQNVVYACDVRLENAYDGYGGSVRPCGNGRCHAIGGSNLGICVYNTPVPRGYSNNQGYGYPYGVRQ